MRSIFKKSAPDEDMISSLKTEHRGTKKHPQMCDSHFLVLAGKDFLLL